MHLLPSLFQLALYHLLTSSSYHVTCINFFPYLPLSLSFLFIHLFIYDFLVFRLFLVSFCLRIRCLFFFFFLCHSFSPMLIHSLYLSFYEFVASFNVPFSLPFFFSSANLLLVSFFLRIRCLFHFLSHSSSPIMIYLFTPLSSTIWYHFNVHTSLSLSLVISVCFLLPLSSPFLYCRLSIPFLLHSRRPSCFLSSPSNIEYIYPSFPDLFLPSHQLCLSCPSSFTLTNVVRLLQVPREITSDSDP